MTLPRPYYEEPGIVIYNDDCKNILPHLEPVDLVLTDPPYGMGKILHGGTWGSNGTEFEKHDYAIWELDDVIAAGRNACIWGGNFFNLPRQRGWIVWHKPGGNGFIGQAELAWSNGRFSVRVFSWSIAATNAERNGHPTLKPLALMTFCLRLFPEAETILDPFMGSGTTLIAARSLGRRAIGIEIEQKYCDIAIKRLSQQVLPMFANAPKEGSAQEEIFNGK